MTLHRYFISILLVLLSGCATGRGQVNPFPTITDSSQTSKIIVNRDSAFMGGAQTYTLTVDGQDIYMLRSGDEISFQINPGEHLLGVKCHGGWQVTGNFSEIAQEMKPNSMYRFKIIPDMSRGCRIERTSQ